MSDVPDPLVSRLSQPSEPGLSVTAASFDSRFSEEHALLVTPPMRYPSGLSPYNILRFASVVIGAGLLLRAGASEQAVSAISHEGPQAATANKPRIALPQPAFSVVAESHKAVLGGGHAPSAAVTLDTPVQRIALPKAAFANTASSVSDSTSSKVALRKSAEAPTAKSVIAKAGPGKVALQDAASLAPNALGSPALATAAMAPAKSASFPAKRMPIASVAEVGPSAGSAQMAPISLSLERRGPEAGLLAPVTLTIRPSSAAISSPARAVSRSLPQPMLRQAAAAPAPAMAQRLSARASPAKGAEPARVMLSLAPPVMTRGPRTTVLTSDINDVMQRPASAWDYAEALPGDLNGYGTYGPRRAEAEQRPAAQQPAPQRLVEAAVLHARTGSVRANSAEPAAQLAKADPGAAVQHAPAPGKASKPLALLDLPPSAAPQAHDAQVAKRRAVAVPANRRGAPLPSPAADQAMVDAVLPAARSGLRRDLLVADPAADPAAPPPRVIAAAGSELPGSSAEASSADSYGASTVLADASAPDGSNTSLRDQIPRPAF